ncbi:LacI family DNA-binding transcriptional regulator [Streptomyces sp. MI02-2A]|uniref:LacI family DNA-binding transcriptional regulator n=1 Tax=Streptomyces sp. MI02-2A TaxID=3028688 RepID=UPI0029B7F0B1|nr:LacI family DNA-binding transcriptional regulator [Streptomyces sp. MI02-2A]MDX3264964.1 LacI family DNA-binding transcriptional regulator [Streptomyces sp. MI02-2A]
MNNETHSPLKVTMAAVAEEAGVSRATASRVFYGSTPVAKHTRQAVYAAAERLGYVPNTMARSLAARSTDILGLLLRAPDNPAYGLLFAELQANVSAAGLQMVTVAPSRHEGAHFERQALNRLLGLRVGGMFVSTGVIRAQMLEPFLDLVPVVVVGRPESHPDIHSVSYDEDHNADLLAGAVAAAGHRSVAVVVPSAEHTVSESRRGAAMARGLTERGVRVHEVSSPTFGTLDEGGQEIVALRREGRITAAMFPSDWRLLTFLPLAQEAGLKVPDDISLTGFDGIMPGIDLLGFTTVRIPVEAAARRAVEVMRAQLEERTQPLHELLPGTLVRGRTLAAAPLPR